MKQGVDFWGLTAQNEPWDGTVPDFTFNAMGWNATTQRDWIVEHLGPALEAAGYAGKVKISNQVEFLLQVLSELIHNMTTDCSTDYSIDCSNRFFNQ